MTPLETLETFTEASLPDLDVVVEGAVALFEKTPPVPLAVSFSQPLVMGSGNAALMGRILFADTQAVFANEGNFQAQLEHSEYDGVVVMSASGKKHATSMVQAAQEKNLPVQLVTSNVNAPAAKTLAEADVFVYSKNREPYTYNTSTYLGPIIGATGESPAAIAAFLRQDLRLQLLRNFDDYRSYTFILPDAMAPVCRMIVTKFDELFGGTVTGRAFTESEIMHAKTVVRSGEELFISLGVANEYYGLVKNRLQITLPPDASFATYMAVSYFVVGRIQAAHPPYFKNNIERYCVEASNIFGQDISPIVE